MRWNALAFSHAPVVFGPALEFCSETRFGRLAEKPVISGAPPRWETSVQSKTVNGDHAFRILSFFGMPRSFHRDGA